MNVATFEVMRAACDQRNTLWAAALATKARTDDSDIKSVISEAVRGLVKDGSVVLATTVWTGSQATPIDAALIDAYLEDDTQWHPRRLPWGKRLRIIATESGRDRYGRGEFGAPEPLRHFPRNAGDALELQSVTCSEALGMVVGVTGFIVFSTLGFIVSNGGIPKSLDDWSLVSLGGWLIGGTVGLTLSSALWGRFFPPRQKAELADNIIPDQFSEGPDVNTFDAFGDPRF